MALLTSAAYQFVKRGHVIFGVGVGYPDSDYEHAAAKLTSDNRTAFEVADSAVKLKQPLPSEYPLLGHGAFEQRQYFWTAK